MLALEILSGCTAAKAQCVPAWLWYIFCNTPWRQKHQGVIIILLPSGSHSFCTGRQIYMWQHSLYWQHWWIFLCTSFCGSTLSAAWGWRQRSIALFRLSTTTNRCIATKECRAPFACILIWCLWQLWTLDFLGGAVCPRCCFRILDTQ